MNAFLSLGRWLFAIPFAVFGMFQFLKSPEMVQQVPNYMPLPLFWVYLNGVAMIAAAICIIVGRYDKLATALLAIFLLIMIALIAVPRSISGGEGATLALMSMLKDIALAGAAMLYAQHFAKDPAVIG